MENEGLPLRTPPRDETLGVEPRGLAQARSGCPAAFLGPGEYPHSIKSRGERPVGGSARTSARPSGADRRRSDRREGKTPSPAPLQSSTTSFLTATTLIYAIGAGITAAAGTRLALQLFLVKGFESCSFQLRDPGRVPYRYLLSLPP